MSNHYKVAILSSVSFNFELVKRQLSNYQLSHGNDAIHFLHVASDGDLNASELSGLDDISVNAESSAYKTSNLCNFGGQLANSQRLFSANSGVKADYVYIHTDADLIVKGNVSSFVQQKKCGFLKQKPSNAWPHFNKMMSDPCFQAIRKHMAIPDSDVIMGRQEGSFFPIELWQEMSQIFLQFYSTDFFEKRNLLWPIEEGIVPTVAQKLIDSHFPQYAPQSKNIVITKPLKPSGDGRNPRDVAENCVQIEDIDKEITKYKQFDCIAMKWFARNIDDKAASYANQLLAQQLPSE
tara:strand:+ start:5074 stop:5955 length:882 start_codon:yes stop_codon:yes gene_type:complete